MEMHPDSTRDFMAKSQSKFNMIIAMIDNYPKGGDGDAIKKYIASSMGNYKKNGEDGFWKYTDEKKMTLLMHIARTNKKSLSSVTAYEIIEEYFQLLNETDNYDNTALMHAAQVGNIEILPALKKYNAETDIKNQDDKTALMLAVQHGHKEFLENIFKLKFNIPIEEQEESLLLAAGYQRTAIVEILLSKGVNPFIKDAQGNTPLMLANSNGDYETASLLRKQYPVSRQIFTMACFGRCLEEAAQTFPEGCIKGPLKHSGYLIKTAMHYLHNAANTQQSITWFFSKKFNKFIPHIMEAVFVNTEREKHIMELFYGESNNPDEILTPTRSSRYQTPHTSLVSGDNNIDHLTQPLLETTKQDQENSSNFSISNKVRSPVDNRHLMPTRSYRYQTSQSLLETTEQDQENFNNHGELNEGGRTSENIHLELFELEAEAKIVQGNILIKQGEIQQINAKKARKRSLIDSPIRQETASTQSARTSSRSSIPKLWLTNSSTTGTNEQLLIEVLSAFPGTNEQASSSSNHQRQHHDSMTESGSVHWIDRHS